MKVIVVVQYFCDIFDAIEHDILLSKLGHYGKRGIENKWLN